GLAEDHYVQLLGLPHRTRHAIEVPYGPDTRVEIEDLAQRDIERADPSPDGRRERALDRHPVLPDRLQRGFGEPTPGLAERLLAGEHLQPLDPPPAARDLGEGGVEHAPRGPPGVRAGAVPLDDGGGG